MQSKVNVDRQKKLFGWYLAYLRKSALDQSTAQKATPHALMGADKEEVKRRIEASLPLSTTGASGALDGKEIAVIFVVSAICGMLVWLVR